MGGSTSPDRVAWLDILQSQASLQTGRVTQQNFIAGAIFNILHKIVQRVLPGMSLRVEANLDHALLCGGGG